MFYIYVMYEWCGFVLYEMCKFGIAQKYNIMNSLWLCNKFEMLWGFKWKSKCGDGFFLLLKMFFSDLKCLQMLLGIPWYSL